MSNTMSNTSEIRTAQSSHTAVHCCWPAWSQGPFYVVISMTQALTREGFNPSRHSWSILANGDVGWIQRANLLVTGLLVLPFAAGLHQPPAASHVPSRPPCATADPGGRCPPDAHRQPGNLVRHPRRRGTR